MIIFSQLWPLLKQALFFEAAGAVSKNWLELKIEPTLADLALLNPWNTLYQFTVISDTEKLKR
jgi:hypothetical protein